MKQIVCEMCGSTDLIKQDGVFVCQTCGTKYSVEEAKKMMVEGVVEVTGTVKIDETDQVNNLITNAERAFSDGRFKQAQELYGQVLQIQPNNVKAIFYEGLSIGWQSSAAHQELTTAVESAKRAIKFAAKDKSCDYKSFTIDVTIHICALGNALICLYSQNATKWVAMANRKTDSLIKMKHGYYSDLSIYDDINTTAENMRVQVDGVKKELQNNVDNIIMVTLRLYNEIYKQLLEKENYGEGYISLLLCPSDDIVKNAFSTKTKNEVLDVKNKFKALEDSYIKKERQERLDCYWNEHSAEKEKLDEEKNMLEKKLKAMKSQYNEVMRKRGDFDNLRKIRDQKITEEVACDKQQDYIDELERRRNACGFFKGKEKKQLQAQIEQEQIKLDNMKTVASAARSKHQDDLNNQINEVRNYGQDVVDEYAKIEKRISEITEELTKDR